MLFNNVIRQTKFHQFTNDDKPKSKNPFKILALIITNPKLTLTQPYGTFI